MQKKKIEVRNRLIYFLKKNWIFLLPVLIAGALTLKWFEGNYLLAAAEEGIPFYNLPKTLSLYKVLWIEHGFGFNDPFFIPRLPLFGYATALFSIGLPTWLIQASVFFILVITPLFAIPKLLHEIFQDKATKLHGYIAALFYVFNLYTMSQVWQRFIYPLMFLWAFSPLFLFLWIKLMKERKVIYLALLALSTFIYSDAFGLASSFLTLAFLALSYVVIQCFKEKKRINFLLFGTSCFIIWTFFQLWWILPIIALRNDSYTSFLNTTNTLASLKEVSQFFPSSQIIQLKQSFFFGQNNFLNYFYVKPPVMLLSYLIAAVVLLGVITSRKKKGWVYVLCLLMGGWFVVKGYNPPLGKEFYTMLFSIFPFTQILRNPYEKFGIVFLIPYAIFFSFGLVYCAEKMKRFKWPFLVVILTIICGLFTWPIWTGDVFTLARVKVPEYYKEANTYLNNYDHRRVLLLPLLKEPTLEYTWRYRGEEPSEFLFDRPSLSRSDAGLPKDAFYLTFPKYFDKPNFTKILSLASVSSVVVRGDTVQNRFNQLEANDYSSLVEKWKGINKKNGFGALDVYTINKKMINDWIYAADTVYFVRSMEDGMEIMTSDSFDPNSDCVIIRSQNDTVIIPKDLGAPKLSFKKLSPTKYTIRVQDAKKPYVLVLSVSYSNLWQAETDSKVIQNHFVVNGFANGWVVDKKGSYTIDVSFDTR